MAYSTSNPPAMLQDRVGGGPTVWMYDDADAATVVRVDGYITNAADLGMKVGDLVIQMDSVAGAVAHQYVVMTINSNGSADLSDGTAISVTNTD